jgi:hypothetical protein
MPVLGDPQSQRCRLGGHHRRSDLHMGRLIPLEKNRSQNECREAVEYTSTVRTTGNLKSWFFMVPADIGSSALLVLEQIGQGQFWITPFTSG